MAVARGHSRAGHVGPLRARKIAAVQEFGPHAGRDAVVAGAGHRAVSDPGGGIAFTSAADLQTKINANPSGTIFVAANSIDWDQNVSTGTKAPKIWIPTGRVMNGGARNIIGISVGKGAELHGGEWTNFASVGGQEFHGPIVVTGDAATLVTDIWSHHNFQSGIGVRTEGLAFSGTTFSHSTVNNNGRYGFTGTEHLSGQFSNNTRFEFLHIHNNNTNNNNPGGNAGGNKISGTINPWIRFCYSHHNTGAGLWTDFARETVLLEENVVELNLWWGIFYEVGTGNLPDGHKASGQIRFNYAKDNALGNGTFPTGNWFNGVQILASCTDGLANGGTGYEIHHNLVDGTARAIGFVAHDNHPTDVKGCLVRDNDVWIRGSTQGVVGGSWEDSSDPRVGVSPWLAGSANQFIRNHYHVPVGGLGASRWRWGGTHGGTLNRTFSQWQSDGNDLEGSLVEIT